MKRNNKKKNIRRNNKKKNIRRNNKMKNNIKKKNNKKIRICKHKKNMKQKDRTQKLLQRMYKRIILKAKFLEIGVEDPKQGEE
jgi:hypothetical protein